MGADIELTPTGEVCGEPVGELRVRASELHGTTIAGDEIPNVIDEIPALAIAAAFADGVTDIRDAAELVVKESNRIGTLHEELDASSASGSRRRADGLVVRGGRAEAGDVRRATATTASRWRWPSPRNALGGGLDRAGLAGGGVVVSRVRATTSTA